MKKVTVETSQGKKITLQFSPISRVLYSLAEKKLAENKNSIAYAEIILKNTLQGDQRILEDNKVFFALKAKINQLLTSYTTSVRDEEGLIVAMLVGEDNQVKEFRFRAIDKDTYAKAEQQLVENRDSVAFNETILNACSDTQEQLVFLEDNEIFFALAPAVSKIVVGFEAVFSKN
ncbi:MAG: hypothetical protein SFU27_06545 [Thermonemataceae bacterium]|nr:hypothetical protein [Thermonemataceae bacterium]